MAAPKNESPRSEFFLRDRYYKSVGISVGAGGDLNWMPGLFAQQDKGDPIHIFAKHRLTNLLYRPNSNFFPSKTVWTNTYSLIK